MDLFSRGKQHIALMVDLRWGSTLSILAIGLATKRDQEGGGMNRSVASNTEGQPWGGARGVPSEIPCDALEVIAVRHPEMGMSGQLSVGIAEETSRSAACAAIAKTQDAQ